jgi:hypothetical protein
MEITSADEGSNGIEQRLPYIPGFKNQLMSKDATG